MLKKKWKFIFLSFFALKKKPEKENEKERMCNKI